MSKDPFHDNDDGDRDRLGPPGAPQTALEQLASLCFEAALTAPGRRIITGTATATLVVVPFQSYFEPLVTVVARLSDRAVVHVVDGKKRTAPDLAQLFAKGRSVVILTHDAALLPSNVTAAADLIVTVKPPTLRMVRAVIRRITGEVARGLTDADLAGRDLVEIAASIRPASSAAECVIRLKRRIVPVAAAQGNTGPRLEDLVLFGEAKVWVEEMLEEIERLRRGDPHAGDIDGTILFGPPGTGKTAVARAVANTAGLPCIETSVASWFINSDGHLDSVLKRARGFFEKLLESAPAVGLLDELDAIPNRANIESRYREYWTSVVTGVLLMISRVQDAKRGVILVGATNYVEHVDSALRRPGRLGRHVKVRPPKGPDEVAALFARYVGADLSQASLHIVAVAAGEATPAMVEGWTKAARRRARTHGGSLTLEDLPAVVAPTDNRAERERRSTALHEAGHAVAAIVLGIGLRSVSVVLADGAGGRTHLVNQTGYATLAEIEDHVVVTLAGRASDAVLGAGADTGARVDLELATSRLTTARISYGLHEALATRGGEGGVEQLLRLDPHLLRLVEADLRRLMDRAEDLVREHAHHIEATAALLMERWVLSGEEVRHLVGSAEPAGRAIRQRHRRRAFHGRAAATGARGSCPDPPRLAPGRCGSCRHAVA